MSDRKTTLLLILDGWGKAPETYPDEQNAIFSAKTPYWNSLLAEYPYVPINTSGNAVGLPEGIMGNSEVGHLNLGAGRCVWQELARIDKEIEKDGLIGNEALAGAMKRARDNGAKLHLMGLVSDGGVHSIDRHYFALLRLAAKIGVPSDRVMFHCFLDGRDTPPRSGMEYVRQLQDLLQKENLGRIASVTGRYYAMDRDKRWDRTKKAYDALVLGKVENVDSSGTEAVSQAYARGENDEFVLPTLIEEGPGRPVGIMESGDQVLFFNFRPDRTRQLSHALVDDEFPHFERKPDFHIDLTTLTRYEEGLKASVAFIPQDISMTLGEVVSRAGFRQLRIAETEKYAHVTYFFSGGQEKEFDGETRILIPSPKVATYDLKPEMSLPEVSERLAQEICSGQYDLIVSNFANGDMVGHTGIREAAIRAAETVDKALALVIGAIRETGARAIITSDHGNCEMMWNFEENCPNTQHSTNKTYCLLVDDSRKNAKLRPDGSLGNIAPTILEMMGLEKPSAMTSESMIPHE